MMNKPLVVQLGIACSILAIFPAAAAAQSSSLQDISRAVEPSGDTTIFLAREIITLDPRNASPEAVAVKQGRIVGVGSVQSLKQQFIDATPTINRTFEKEVIVPGFIAQHDHPLLTSLTMTAEIIAIEDWVLPSGTVRAAQNRDDYLRRLMRAEAKLNGSKEPLITWGFHHYFFGKLTRSDLDKISSSRPILVWHRSCHEFILNSAAMEAFEITESYLQKQTQSAQEQSNLDEGHFWEQGLFGVLPQIAPAIATPERLEKGLRFTHDYLHANGVTLACEPGGLLSKALQDAQNAVLSDRKNAFRFYFIPDGKSLIASQPDNTIAATEQTLDWGSEMTSMVPKQIKLFADGAIYSQLMQLRDGYTDGHEGEWMMDEDVFAKAFRVYWDAGYQIHIHVNGDAGLDRVLNTLAENLRRQPRTDHRTVIVHFAVSSREQVDRIKQLGAIVSANPYYPVALADNYGKAGLGPARADPMVRLGDVERAGISFSCHSDMPMAPAQPLFLMHCAVNRVTNSGRIAAPNQRVSREGALRSVTLDAAYSLRMEKQVGSIQLGKLANFTVLSENPIRCAAAQIKDIRVLGTVHEGRVFSFANAEKTSLTPTFRERQLAEVRRQNSLSTLRDGPSGASRSSSSANSSRCFCDGRFRRQLAAALLDHAP